MRLYRRVCLRLPLEHFPSFSLHHPWGKVKRCLFYMLSRKRLSYLFGEFLYESNIINVIWSHHHYILLTLSVMDISFRIFFGHKATIIICHSACDMSLAASRSVAKLLVSGGIRRVTTIEDYSCVYGLAISSAASGSTYIYIYIQHVSTQSKDCIVSIRFLWLICVA